MIMGQNSYRQRGELRGSFFDYLFIFDNIRSKAGATVRFAYCPQGSTSIPSEEMLGSPLRLRAAVTLA
jgi:hypothetical protein